VKVALIHDWLTGMRGGEKCLEVFCEMYPDAPIFTLVHRPGSVSEVIESHPIHTSFLQRAPFGTKRYQRYLPLYPAAIERFDLRGFDLILSSSHAAAKGVVVHPGSIHVSYCHTPMRYVWMAYEQYFGGGRYRFPTSWMLPPVASWLRTWDVVTSLRVDHFIANSHNVAGRILRYYAREASVVHPWVDLEKFRLDPEVRREDFLLVISALVPYKRVDLAIETARRLGRRLLVVGSGMERARLEKLAGNNAEFLGWLPDEELLGLLQRTQALLFPGEEDFGIVPLEAMACGAPVIAYGVGGVLETVVDGRTGILFEEQEVEAMVGAVQKLETSGLDPADARRRAESFSPDFFRMRIEEEVAAALR